MNIFALRKTSDDLKPVGDDLEFSTATLPDTYLRRILDKFQKPHPDVFYDVSTIANPNGNGDFFFNTNDMKDVQPHCVTLHGSAAAIVAAVICTETEPIVLPRNDNIQHRESMITVVQTILNRLNEHKKEDRTISIALMDTSHDIRLAAMGYKTAGGKIILSFASIDLSCLQHPDSMGAQVLHSQLQVIAALVPTTFSPRFPQSISDPSGRYSAFRSQSPLVRSQSSKDHMLQRNLVLENYSELSMSKHRRAHSLPPQISSVYRVRKANAFQAFESEDDMQSFENDASYKSFLDAGEYSRSPPQRTVSLGTNSLSYSFVLYEYSDGLAKQRDQSESETLPPTPRSQQQILPTIALSRAGASPPHFPFLTEALGGLRAAPCVQHPMHGVHMRITAKPAIHLQPPSQLSSHSMSPPPRQSKKSTFSLSDEIQPLRNGIALHPTANIASLRSLFQRKARTSPTTFHFERRTSKSSIDVGLFLYGSKWKKYVHGKSRSIDFNLGNPSDSTARDKHRRFKPFSESFQRLLSFGTPQLPSESILSGNRLYPHEYVQLGNLCKSTYQALNGNIVIQIQNKFRRNPSDITVFGELGISEGALPFATAGASTSISRAGYCFITGKPALTKVLVEIEQHSKLRKCFLSCMIRGTILLSERSTSDGFVSTRVNRLCNGGVVMKDRVPLCYFHELGGGLGTIGQEIVFKSHSEAQSHEVIHIDDTGVLHIGEEYQQKLHHQELKAHLLDRHSIFCRSSCFSRRKYLSHHHSKSRSVS